MAVRFRTALGSGGRVVATALLSSVLTATILTAVRPERAVTSADSILVEDALYPVTLPGDPALEFESHEAFLADYLAVKRDLEALHSALDYDAAHGSLSPALHEWADRERARSFNSERE